MVGRKSKVLLDSIDLEILKILNEYSSYNGLGILELTNKIKLTHQNLKKHLEKLIRIELVLPLTESSNNKITLVTPYFFRNYASDDYDPNAKKIKQMLEEYYILLSFLKKVNKLDSKSETISKIAKEMKGNISSLKPKKIKQKKKSKKQTNKI